jgi:hypothetical protein
MSIHSTLYTKGKEHHFPIKKKDNSRLYAILKKEITKAVDAAINPPYEMPSPGHRSFGDASDRF